MFRTLAVSLLSLLLCASVAFAEKPLVVASDPTFPPNEMLNKDKEIVGFSIDYIKAVGKEAGFDVQVKNIAWDGIFAALAFESGGRDRRVREHHRQAQEGHAVHRSLL